MKTFHKSTTLRSKVLSLDGLAM